MREATPGPSRTAILTAVTRALHREEPQPWVMDDYLAPGLAGPEGQAMLERLRTEVPRAHLLAFSRWMCVRARFAGLAAEMGEPFISRFRPAEIEQLLRGHGFGDITDFGADEARAAYFQGRAGVEIAGAQRLIAATVSPALPVPGPYDVNATST